MPYYAVANGRNIGIFLNIVKFFFPRILIYLNERGSKKSALRARKFEIDLFELTAAQILVRDARWFEI